MSRTLPALAAALDLELWGSVRPGADTEFDVDRFGEWLELLVEAGDALAARTVGALDTSLVVAGLSRYIRVFDPGIFEPTTHSDDEPQVVRHEAMHEGDAAIDALECEIGGYIVRARREDAWDAIVALLTALDGEHGAALHAIMHGCRRLSNSTPETDELDDLLLAPQQHLHDVTVEREGRLAEQGFASPADARAFLQMARQSTGPRRGASPTALGDVNPIVTAYFRAADTGQESPAAIAESVAADAIVEQLAEAGVLPDRPRALLAAPATNPSDPRLPHLQRGLAHAHDVSEGAYLMRGRELAFLANTLLAGCAVQSRPFTPQEASEAAACVCNLGLEHASAPDSFLLDNSLVTAFEAGWSVLHRDVALFVADQLVAMLDAFRDVDPDTQRGLGTLRRTLVAQRAAGTPWLARNAAEVLGELDVASGVAVLGLLDECPVVHAALTAVLEGGIAPVSPTAFTFIATAAQLQDVRRFMRALPDLLAR